MALLGTKWTVETFNAAQTQFIVPTRGWTYRGLGLYRNFAGLWWLVHLNTGHGVVRLGYEDENGLGHDSFAEVEGIATEIAQATDWTFSGVGGWQNRDPGLPKKLQAIADAHPGMVASPAAANVRRNEEKARAIAMSRLDG